MKRIRRIELGLEQVLDSLAGRVFRGPLHPKELIGRIERAADMASLDTDLGPRTSNVYRLALNPEDLRGQDLGPLQAELTSALEQSALERGWRLDGPAKVMIVGNERVPAGTAKCTTDSIPGERRPWCRLVGETEKDVRVNRAVVGRSAEADVVLEDDTVSRRHAVLWTEWGSSYVLDLGSTNGTFLDGELLGESPRMIGRGSVLTFGAISFRFELND